MTYNLSHSASEYFRVTLNQKRKTIRRKMIEDDRERAHVWVHIVIWGSK